MCALGCVGLGLGAVSAMASADSVNACRPSPGHYLCHGSVSLTYAGKVTTFAPAECALDTASFHTLEISYNYPPGSKQKYFLADIQVEQHATKSAMVRFSFAVAGKSPQVEVIPASARLVGAHTSGTVSGTTSPGHQKATATFRCR